MLANVLHQAREGAGSRVAPDLGGTTGHGRDRTKGASVVRRPSTAHFATGAASPVARPEHAAVLKDIYPSLEAAVAAGPPDGNGAAVPPAEQAHRSLELFDTVVTSLFDVGLSLHVAMDLPADAARERIAAAIGYLDETIREVRGYAFTARGHQTAAGAPSRDDTV
jgi:hypothetical protein